MQGDKQAKDIFAAICAALDEKEWRYVKRDAEMTVSFGVRGEDLPFQTYITVDDRLKMISVTAPIGFHVSKEKRTELAVATCVASGQLSDGHFAYDIMDGTIHYRRTLFYQGSRIGRNLFPYLIDDACTVVDEYNDRFLALSDGTVTLRDFIKG